MLGTVVPVPFRVPTCSTDYQWPQSILLLLKTVAGIPRIRLLNIAREDLAPIDTSNDAGAQSVAFEEAVRDGLLKAANWLNKQPVSVFEDLRKAGCITDIFAGGWIDQDQFDLDIPPEFRPASGRLGLVLSIYTND